MAKFLVVLAMAALLGFAVRWAARGIASACGDHEGVALGISVIVLLGSVWLAFQGTLALLFGVL